MNLLTWAAVAAVTLPPFVGHAFECEHVLARSSCICAVASNVKQKGGRVSIGSVIFDNCDPAHCPKLTDGKVTTYQEENGKPGYQDPDPDSDPPDPGDKKIDEKCAKVAQPSDQIVVGSFTNGGTQGETATEWEVTVTDENGDTSQFSGTF